jgi:hypothetical protein
MRALVLLLLICFPVLSFSQSAWYDRLDTAMKEKRAFALSHHLKEIKRYHFTKDLKADSTLLLYELYDADGRVQLIRDYRPESGNACLESVYTYDEEKKLVKIIKKWSDALDRMDYTAIRYGTDTHIIQIDKDDFAQAASIKPITTDYTYYPNGKIRSIVREGYSENYFNYDKQGLLKNISANQHDTSRVYFYDRYGFLIKNIASQGTENDFVNDSLGNNLIADTYLLQDGARILYAHYEARFSGKNIVESHEDRCPHIHLDKCVGKVSFLNHILFEYNDHGLESRATTLNAKGKMTEMTRSFYTYY